MPQPGKPQPPTTGGVAAVCVRAATRRRAMGGAGRVQVGDAHESQQAFVVRVLCQSVCQLGGQLRCK